MTTDTKLPLPTLETFTHPPTQPGWYWFKDLLAVYTVMVEVREVNGQMMVWLLRKDEPVANLKGEWQGPIPDFTGSAERHES